VCAENRVAICNVIDSLITSLSDLRDTVASSDREALLRTLGEAQAARRNLPGRVSQPSAVIEVRIPVPDRPGVLAEVTTLATELGVNIADLEIAHSTEGDAGVLLMLVEAAQAEPFRAGLAQRGYRPTLRQLD
jgi:prephenate dehydrogenase